MKDIEKALETEYSDALGSVTYKNKSRLYSLYDERTRHSPTVGKIVVRRAVAIAACAALFLVTTTAFALTRRPNYIDEVRSAVAQHLGIKGASEEKIDELTKFGEKFILNSDTLEEQLENTEVNSYGEVIGSGLMPLYCDLFIVKSYSNGGKTNGYVYRYDYGFLDSNYFTNQEDAYIKHGSDQIISQLNNRAPDGYRRNWVYVYDREGMEIIGKCTKERRFYKTEELQDPTIAKQFEESEYYQAYDKFCENRTEQKKETGLGFVSPKLEFKYEPLPTEGFTIYTQGCSLDVITSDDAVAVSSDPSVFEVEEVMCQGSKTDSPFTWVGGYLHSIGTCTITITDGDNEYVFEIECYDAGGHYGVERNRIK